MRLGVRCGLVGMVLAALVGSAAAGHLQREQVSPTVYVVRPVPGDLVAVSNAAFVLLPDRVLVVDTLSSSELMAEMLTLIREVTKLPVGMVALTHWHPDHSGGLEALTSNPCTLFAAPGTADHINRMRNEQIGFLHEQEKVFVRRARAAVDSTGAAEYDQKLQEVRQEIGRLQRLPPVKVDIVVDPVTELAPGNFQIFLQHTGPAHTDTDLMVYVAHDKVLLAGDLLTVATLPNLSDAYSAGWIRRLNEIEGMNLDRIVPGHGPVGTMKDVALLRTYLETLRTMVKPIADHGTFLDLVQKLRVPSPYDTWEAQELWFTAAQRVFAEMKGQVPPPSSR